MVRKNTLEECERLTGFACCNTDSQLSVSVGLRCLFAITFSTYSWHGRDFKNSHTWAKYPGLLLILLCRTNWVLCWQLSALLKCPWPRKEMPICSSPALLFCNSPTVLPMKTQVSRIKSPNYPSCNCMASTKIWLWQKKIKVTANSQN